MTDAEKDGPIQFERDGMEFTLWLAVRKPSQWSTSGVMTSEGQHYATPADLAAAGYIPLAAVRAFVARLCEPAPDDLPTTLSELLAMVELEVNSEYEHAVSAETALTTVHSEHEATNSLLGGLLARIHRDGGHRQTEIGTADAVAEADSAVVRWLASESEHEAIVQGLRGELETTKARLELADVVTRSIGQAVDHGISVPATVCVAAENYDRDQQSTAAAESIEEKLSANERHQIDTGTHGWAESAKVAEGEESLRGYLLELGSAFEMQEGYSFSALTEDIIAYLRNTEGLTAQLKAKLREREAEEERRWSVRYDAACTERDMAEARADELEAKLRERDIERGAVSSIVQAHGSLVRGLLLNECQSARDSSQLPRQLQLTSVLTLWQRLMDAERDALRSQPSPTTCVYGDCKKPPTVNGYCDAHWEQKRVDAEAAGATSATGEAKPAECTCAANAYVSKEHADWCPLFTPQPAQKAAERNWFPSPYHVAEAARSARHDELEPADPAPPAEVAVAPIPMFLTCPACTCRHIDEGEFATKIHHTHSCQECGLTWRPAVVPTVGVQFLPGFKNQTADELAKGREGSK